LWKNTKERIMTNKKKSAVYTKEFQDGAIRLCKQPNRTVASVAQELKIPAWKLRNWVNESKQKLEKSAEVEEISKLEERVQELEEEIAILKKAAAYFAKNLT
jgi:transposase